MKNKKGFTLIELLAVIVILAIVALIAVPVILNIIDKANKSAFKDTAYGIVSAAELYFAEQQLDLTGMILEKTFELPSQANSIDGLQLKGNVPIGMVKVTTDGQVAIAVQNGRYCVTKSYIDTDVMISEDIEDCKIEKRLFELTTTTNQCATNKTVGACDPGTMFTINVNDNEPKNFYVISDEGDKVTLIMSENLGDTVAWYAAALTNEFGPLTAINRLDKLTDEEWSSISKRDYIYGGIGHDSKTRKYNDITRTMRARMITYDEINTIKVLNNNKIPNWLHTNLYTDNDTSLPYGYWTSTAYASNSTAAYHVYYKKYLNYLDVNAGKHIGVRPVIELSK